ncbi:hypothetical protein [Alkalimarinus alittae]|uniref:Uncharacterized protein n=1 Tax=Alkalimarinus alittae TaxID=2961619 RepID=A0ABY6N5T9_9ALTE|nr:hypothetical protein [Alkalimarinus alittae]UZE97476.1 hypothetical protein NKI27_06955 [Alkalimarinus alittae]
MYPELLSFLSGVLTGKIDAATFRRTELTSIYLEGDCLIFSLKGLYDCFSGADKGSYSEFIKMLYSSTLNSDLAALGGRVEVHQSTSKIETSLYRLVRV